MREDVGLLGGLGGRNRRETVLDGQVAVGRARQLGHDHRAAAVAEVLGVGVSLRAVAENGNRLVLQQGKVRVFVVINLRRHNGYSWLSRGLIGWFSCGLEPRTVCSPGLSFAGCPSPLPRTMAMRPVRASSMMPKGRIISMKASTLPSWPAISMIIVSGATSTIRPRKISVSWEISARRPGGRRDLDQHQVAFDVVLRADVVDADDGHDFFQLLPHLLQHAVVADDDEGHPRELGVFGLPHRQAVDVVAARGQHARDVREHARHVLDQCGKHVTHGTLRKTVKVSSYPPGNGRTRGRAPSPPAASGGKCVGENAGYRDSIPAGRRRRAWGGYSHRTCLDCFTRPLHPTGGCRGRARQRRRWPPESS